jgi:protoporphyrinogen oxidase
MKKLDVIIVGGGFTGLTAGYVLSKMGKKVAVVEADATPGGLAGTFNFKDGVHVEKFYHHWFNSDRHVTELVKELGLDNEISLHPTQTGMYFNGRIWKLSTPLDLLKFRALSFFDRLRLGFLVFQVRRLKDWKSIEHLSIREWLEPLCGSSVYKVVWDPLVKAKFSIFAESVSAVWMWKKLVLRGGTRNDKGKEELAYFKGGFGRLAQKLVDAIRKNGSECYFGCRVTSVEVKNACISAIQTDQGRIEAKQFLFTPSFSIIAKLMEGSADKEWVESLRRVKYLGNMCLVLRLTKSLSKTYWLNVNDPSFPFVGVIEHTNFDSPDNYCGSHIVYLSRYLAVEDPVWDYTDKEYFEFAMTHLKKMFPEIDGSWVVDYKVWRSEFAQPVTEKNYSDYVPRRKTPFNNVIISTMAQIYPEDRGTNYAIRDGRSAAELVARELAE